MVGQAVVAVVYFALGTAGVVFNGVTVAMISAHSVYRLSAYTLMANVAVADCLMTLVAGCYCGAALLIELNESPNAKVGESTEETSTSLVPSFVAFVEIAAWTTVVVSYACLGINRCIAICYYGTKAKSLNRVSVALAMAGVSWLIGICAGWKSLNYITKAKSLNRVSVALAMAGVSWLIGICAALVGTMPTPVVLFRREMWTMGFVARNGTRPSVFLVASATVNVLSVAAQWICSILVLLKIRTVEHKISHNKLNQNSANRFRKQARLTFQFFYPSLICTLSSAIYFSRPFFVDNRLEDWQFILLHTVWLINHLCNPLIYAYFNDRMRATYRQWIACVPLRRFWYRKKRPFDATSSRRSNRSGGHYGENFVRNSLQMQSRDFEQLCEFMMRVNPLYDSSEGWRESSDDDYDDEPTRVGDSAPELATRSIVMDLGRQTVEHWAQFAKKASI
uniref:G-protein coupled receptors family 1 profile domain-containing protein n=1 Tax=Plectus sambesii TaxID=2011161 RepID=A0A914V4D5_9BILA